jgi:hypothetical protein
MIIHIIGCGSSAQYWNGEGYSLGINDSFKWGYKLDALVISNRPGKFPQERLEVIKRSKPDRFFSPLNNWKFYFPHWEEIKLRSWDGHLYKKEVVHTDSSASIAMGVARKLGAKQMILWGIDMRDHKTFNPGNPHNKEELRQLKGIVEALRGEGIEVYLGAKESELESFLTVK